MAYKVIKEQKGMLVRNVVKKTFEETVSADKKDFIRKDIEKDVFDTEDAIADNAKMLSLLTTIVSRMYDVLDDTQKDALGADDRSMIEYTFKKFKTTNTRADVQFATEGITLVDKLLDRQGQIGSIIANS